MKTHRKLVLAIATALSIGLTASGGAFGHGWGYGNGYGGQGYRPWVHLDQPAGYQYRHRHFQGDTTPGPGAGYGGRRVQQTGAPHYGRRLHAREGVGPPGVEGQAFPPRYGTWLGRPGRGPFPPPQPGECPNVQDRQSDDGET